VAARRSGGFSLAAGAFLEALEETPPDALTGCALWRAHEVVAHLDAGLIEIARHLEAAAEGRPIPTTRGFEEREAPYRAMEDRALRADLLRSIGRVAAALDAVLERDPAAVVPWTGRQMRVASFVTHLRSEFALHRFDLVGDDQTGRELLGQPELTDHAVAVLGRALLARGANRVAAGFSAVIAAPGSGPVVVGDPELSLEASPSGGRHVHDPTLGAPDPTEIEEPAQQAGAEGSSEMRAPLAPVDAGASERASPGRLHVHAELGKARPTGLGEGEAPGPSRSEHRIGPASGILLDPEHVAGDERVQQGDAESAGQMVVAGPCPTDRRRVGSLAERADLPARGEAGEGLERLRHLGRGDPEVPVAT
jgi:hypothetical protein